MLQHHALCKFHVTDGQNMRDQIKRVKSHVCDHIAFGIFHSFFKWKSKGLLATYNLEIRIAGSSCRLQLFIHLSISENTDKLKFNHKQSASQKT